MELIHLAGKEVVVMGFDELYQYEALIRFFVFRRDNFTCVYCGRHRFRDRVGLVPEHVVPEHAGGQFSFQNIVTACNQCNCGKRGHQLSEKDREQLAQYTAENSKRFEEETGVVIPSLGSPSDDVPADDDRGLRVEFS